jgi:hypothetical protein
MNSALILIGREVLNFRAARPSVSVDFFLLLATGDSIAYTGI